MCISTIESKWHDKKNWSVKAIYDLLSDLHYGSPHHYHYETANSKEGFLEALARRGTAEGCNYISINCHGNQKGINLHNGEVVSYAAFRNVFLRIRENFEMDGIHFGACEFLNEELVRYFYDKPISIPWMSGYTKEVNWIDSTAFDFLFFNKLLSGVRDPDDPFELISEVATELKKECSGLIKRLGFQIYMGVRQDKNHPKWFDNVERICG